MTSVERPPDASMPADGVDRAVDLFLQRRAGFWIDGEPEQTEALRRVERAWQAVGNYADTPEFMVLREQALTRARRANLRRWYRPGSARRWWLAAASIAGLAVAAGAAWQFFPGPSRGVYETRIGEQRVLELEDHSMVALDAKTRVRVHYSADARVVEVAEGQAQFSVAQDLRRPFKVMAGDRTIVALGTVFTVAYLDREVEVALIEGRVAVFAPAVEEKREIAELKPIELHVGEALQVQPDGRSQVTAHADMKAATAWRQGQVVFHDEPLGEAVRRLNRYSRVQLKVTDPQLARLSVSGLFDAGDTRAFARALEAYLPVVAEESGSGNIELRVK